MMDHYVEDHKPFAHHVVATVPGAARGSLKTFLEKLGYNQKEMAEYLIKHENEIRSAVNIPDPKSSKAINDALRQSKEFFKYADYVKWGGWAFAGLGFYSGFQSDTDSGKTVGEALTHNLAALGGTALGSGFTLGAVALGASPVGWAAVAGIGIGTGLTAAFNYFYDNNTFGIQDELDKAGQKLDEWWSDGKEAVGGFFQNAGESIASGLDAINPFT